MKFNKNQIVFNQWGNCLTRKAFGIIAIFMILGVMFSCTVTDPHDGLRVPTSFAVSSISTNTVTLSWGWNPDYDTTNYYILSNQTVGEHLATIEANSGKSESHYTAIINSLTPNTGYTFYLKACGDWGCSTNSSVKATTRPAPPENFNFVSNENTPTSLSFAWEAPTIGGANHYKLYQDNNAIEKNIEDTKQSVSGLESGTEYTFGLVACNVNNLCSTTNSLTVTTPPSKVTGLAIKGDPGSTTVTISWTKPQGTTSYVLLKRKGGETTFEKVDKSPNDRDSEFTIGDLTSETNYTFSLQACNAAGCSDSATVNGQTAKIVYAPTDAPGKLRHTHVSSTNVALEWDAVEGATYYPVLYKTGSGPEVSNSVSNASKFATTALTANTEYTFSVKACNIKGCFDQASSTNITTAPNTLQGFTNGTVTSMTVDLKWDTVTGANSYIVYTNSSGSSFPIATNTGTTYTAKGLNAGIEYTFSLKACNDFGCSDQAALLTLTTAPGTPQEFIAVTVNSTNVRFRWGPVDGATHYMAQSKHVKDSITYSNTIEGYPPLGYTFTNLTDNTTYSFELKACNRFGCSEATIKILTTTPKAPINFTNEKVTSTTAVLKWDAVTGASNYIVYRNGDAIATNSGIPPATTYIATGLDANKEYTFKVQTCMFGAFCSDKTEYTLTTAPNTPQNLAYETVTSTNVALKWKKVKEAKSYIVYTNSFTGLVPIATNTGATTYTAGMLTANTPYTFSVKACNNNGCSDQADLLTLTTAPDTPQNLHTPNVASTTADLKWSPVEGANSYIVYTNSSGSLVPIATNTGNPPATTYSVAGLTAKTKYTFSVKACNDFGCSASATNTPTTAQEAPQNFTNGKVTSTTVDLKWDGVDNAKRYVVYWGENNSANINDIPPSTTYTVTGLTANKKYTFSVKACIRGEFCTDRTEYTLTTAPDTPQNFTNVTMASTTADFQWDAVEGATHYMAYSKKNSGEHLSSTYKVGTGSSPTSPIYHTFTNLAANSSYYFAVEACNKYGCSAGTHSNLITAPEAPENFTVTATPTTATLVWNAVTKASKYIVYQNKDDSTTPIATNEGNMTTNYTATGLAANTGYSFSVRACNDDDERWCSDPSQSLNIQTPDLQDSFEISYSNMASTAAATSWPKITSGKNCDILSHTLDGNAKYSISALTDGGRVLPNIGPTTGVVSNNGVASPGVYKVTVTVPENDGCNTDVLVYNTITPAGKDILSTAINEGTNLHGNKGNFNYIITEKITDMSKLFHDRHNFNGNISEWDTSQVKSMDHMFNNAYAFDQPIGEWNTSNVTSMYGVFNYATTFNQPLSNWNTSKVTTMKEMFRYAEKFDQDISGWNTENVKNMVGMFLNAYEFKQPIGEWKTGNVTDMSRMFLGALSFDRSLNDWDTGNVTNMRWMFSRASVFNQPLSKWKTSHVTDMNGMFKGATNFNQPLNDWNTVNVEDMQEMFNGASAFNQPLSKWKTGKVTNMQEMFNYASNFNQPLNNWDTSQVEDMQEMFHGASVFNQHLSNWNTTNVESMKGMFEEAHAFNRPLSSWYTVNVRNMNRMFYNATKFSQVLRTWTLNGAGVSHTDMFTGSAMEKKLGLHPQWKD